MMLEWYVMNENKILLPSFFRGHEFSATYNNAHSGTIFLTPVRQLQNTSFSARHCNSSRRKPCCPSSLNIESKPLNIGLNTIHWTEPRGTPAHGKSEYLLAVR